MPRQRKANSGKAVTTSAKPLRRARTKDLTGDVALVVGRTPDQRGYHIMRRRSEDHPVEVGTVMPMREGEPIEGEVLSFRPRKDLPFLHDVKVQFDARELANKEPSGQGQEANGPAQVASNEYRRGWDLIWGARERGGRPAQPN